MNVADSWHRKSAPEATNDTTRKGENIKKSEKEKGMSTRYLLTLCTAFVLGWALITGWMNALGRVVVANPPVAESWLKMKSPIALVADGRVKGQQLDVENTKGVVMPQDTLDSDAAGPAADIAKGLDGVKSGRNALKEEGTPSKRDGIENSQDSREFDGRGRTGQPGSLQADRVKMTIFSLGLLTMRPLGHG